jgi:GT2 family glycosyltransferase
VVLNWNGWPETQSCVARLLESERKAFVIVVDNGSRSHPYEEAVAALPGVTLLKTGKNLGYAGGNNHGIRVALGKGAEYVWVLNNDTAPEPDALHELARCAEADPRLGVLTSSVRTPSGELERGNAFQVADAREWSFDLGSPGEVICEGCSNAAGGHPADIVRGPSLFFRSSALAEVGLFDERYFHYFEEMDLVERLRRKGWRAGFACRSRVEHTHGGTLSHLTPQSMYYLHRNHFLFRKKLFGEGVARALSTNSLRRLRILAAPRYLISGDFRVTAAHALAVIDAARGRTGPRDLGAGYRRPVELKYRPPHA